MYSDKTSRVLEILITGNRAINKAKNVKDFCGDICSIIVNDGGYRLAWIGLAERNRKKSILPIAHCGLEDGYLESLEITWSDNAHGQGPTGTAVRTGEPVIAREIFADPIFKPRTKEVIRGGYASSAALPVIFKDEVLGALNIYSTDGDAFDSDETGLLMKLADDIACGIDVLKSREKNREMLEKLTESEAHYRQLFNSSPDALFIINSEGRFIDVNRVAIQRYGYSRGELLNIQPENLAAPGLVTLPTGKMKQALKHKTAFEWKHRRKDGSEIPVEVNTAPITFRGKSAVIASIRDITELKQTEESLRTSEAYLRNVFEMANDGVYIISADNRYIDSNGRGLELLGYSLEELRKMGVADVLSPHEVARLSVEPPKMMSGIPHLAEWEHVRKDGSVFPGEVSARRLDDRSYLAIVRDLTERRKAENALRESEERLRLSTELANVAVWEFDFTTDTMTRSQNHDELYGLEIQDKWQFGTFLNATHPDDREMSNAMIQKSVAPGGPDQYTFDFRVVYPDKSVHWLMVIGQVVKRDDDGQGVLVRGTLIDITARKNTEKDLVRSQSLLIDTQKIGNVGGWELDTDTQELTWTEEVYRIHELDPDSKLTVEQAINYYAPSSRPIIERFVQRAIEKGEPFSDELEIITAKGNRRWVKTIGRVDPGHHRVFGFFQDITDRKKAEEARRKSESLFRIAFEHSGLGMCLTGLDGKLIRVNGSLCSMLGYTRAELEGKHFNSFSHHDDQKIGSETISKLISGQTNSAVFEKRYLTKSASPIWVHINTSLLHDDAGKPVHFITQIEDITEIKQTRENLRRSEEQFSKAFHVGPTGMTITRIVDGKFIDVNASFLNMFEFSRNEVIGHTSTELNMWTPDERKRLIEKQIATGGLQSFELNALTKSGKEISLLLSSKSLKIEAEDCLITTMIDITKRKRAVEELRLSEEKFSKSFKSSPAALLLTRLKDGRYLEVNETYCALVGYERDALIGHNTTEFNIFINSSDRQKIVNQLLEKKSVRDFETSIRNKSGEIKHILASQELMIADGEKCILSSMVDITERKQAENALFESEERNRLVLENSMDAILMTTPDGTILSANRAACEMLHRTEEEICKLGRKGLMDPEDPRLPILLKERERTGKIKGELTMLRKDGSKFPVELSSSIFLDQQGEKKTSMIIRDITERKQAEEIITNINERFSLATRAAKLGVWDWDVVNNILNWDDRMFELYGIHNDGSQNAYETWVDRLYDDDRSRCEKEIDQAFRGEKEFDTEFRIVWPDGTLRYLKAYAIIIRDKMGKPLRMIGVNYDITENKLVTEALLKSEEKFTTLFKAAPGSIILASVPDGKIVEVNDNFSKITGYSREEALGKTTGDLGMWVDPEFHTKYLSILERDGLVQDFAADLNHKTGIIRNGLLSGYFITIQGKKYLLGTFYDITSQKRAEIEIHRQTKELTALNRLGFAVSQTLSLDDVISSSITETLRAASPDMTIIFLKDGETLNLTGFGPKQAADVAGKFHPHKICLCLCGLAAKQAKAMYSKDIYHDPRCTRDECKEAGFRSLAAIPLISGEEILGVLGLASKEERDFELKSEFLETFASQVAGGIRNAQLYSEIQSYAEKLEERVDNRTAQLKAANEGLESFAYSVSHDLRAPLRAMSGFSNALLEDYADRLDEQGRNFIMRIVGAAHQMEILIQDLLNYSRIARTDIEFGSISLNDVMENVQEQLLTVITDHKVNLTFPKNLPAVVGVQTLIVQIISNLISNAIKFVPAGIKPHVKVSCTIADDRVIISIRDNGIGIEPEYHERIFKVFERLHGVEAYSGSGIGLAIVKKAIEKLGGRVWVDSAIGKGSTFHIEFIKAPA